MRRALRKLLPLVILLGGLTAAADWGWSWWRVERFRVSTDNAFIHGDIVTVGAKVSGYVAEVLIDDNRPVEAGDILLRIEDADYRAEVERAEAAVARAEAEEGGQQERMTLQDARIREAEASVSAARADLALAQRDLTRSGRLLREGWTPEQAHDRATTDVERRQAALTRAEAGVVAARRQRAVIAAEAAEIAARKAEALAALALAQIRLSDTLVRAPAAGVVGNKQVEPGEFVRPGAPLLAVVPLDNVWVIANFKETQLDRLAVGQAVEVTVDGYPGARLSGRVDSLSPGSGAAFSLLPPDNATGNFIRVVQRVPVKIRLDPAQALKGRLVPGLLAKVAVTVGDGPGWSARPQIGAAQADANRSRP